MSCLLPVLQGDPPNDVSWIIRVSEYPDSCHVGIVVVWLWYRFVERVVDRPFEILLWCVNDDCCAKGCTGIPLCNRAEGAVCLPMKTWIEEVDPLCCSGEIRFGCVYHALASMVRGLEE